MNRNFICYTILFGLSIEEIFTVIFSISDRPFSNIILQVYPSFLLIGNLGEILKSLNCQINMCGISIPQDDINIFIQILFQLLISEKYKLLYVNGILGGLVNIISIMYQCFILIKTKYKIEKTDVSLNRIIE